MLTTDQALDLCGSFGIPVAEWAVVHEQDSAALAAATFGYPVVVKGLSRQTTHKSEVGLVELDVEDEEQLREAFERVQAALEEHDQDSPPPGILVQRLVTGGQEVIIGGKRDPSFGPVVMFGLGGVYVEALKDVAFRLAPLSREEAWQMMDEVRGTELLNGWRSEPPVDRGAVVDALLAVANLLVSCPEVTEIDVNPLVALKKGCAAVDARAIVRRQRA